MACRARADHERGRAIWVGDADRGARGWGGVEEPAVMGGDVDAKTAMAGAGGGWQRARRGKARRRTGLDFGGDC